MGVAPEHPEHDKVELSIDERIDWGTLCAYNAELGRELARIVKVEEIAAEAIANADPEVPEEEDFLWLEVPLIYARAEAAYAAWWAFVAGNAAALADTREVLDDFWSALGFELYGSDEDADEEDDE